MDYLGGQTVQFVTGHTDALDMTLTIQDKGTWDKTTRRGETKGSREVGEDSGVFTTRLTQLAPTGMVFV